MASVQEKRFYAHIRAGNPAYRFWTEEEIKLLGTMPDHDLARLIKRHPSTVQSKRLSLAIPYLKPHYKAWSATEISLLGKHNDEFVARQVSRATRLVRRKRVSLKISNPFESGAGNAMLPARKPSDHEQHSHTITRIASRVAEHRSVSKRLKKGAQHESTSYCSALPAVQVVELRRCRVWSVSLHGDGLAVTIAHCVDFERRLLAQTCAAPAAPAAATVAENPCRHAATVARKWITAGG